MPFALLFRCKDRPFQEHSRANKKETFAQTIKYLEENGFETKLVEVSKVRG